MPLHLAGPILMLAALVGCAPSPASDDGGADNGLLAEIVLQEDDWTVAYTLPSPQETLLFDRAAGTRAHRWMPLTKGVRTAELGGFDAILIDTLVRRLAFSFDPYTQPIPQDYTPFIPFSDGGYAVYTGQFGLLSVEDREAAQNLQGSFEGWKGEQFALRTRFTLDRPIVTAEGTVPASETVEVEGSTYVYVGETTPFESGDLTLVLDPGLPVWLTAGLEDELAKVFAAHEAAWGADLPDGALLFLAYGGADQEGFSNTGSVAGNVLGASLSGRALLSESPAIQDYLTWFFAHEAAHLFQNAAGTPLINNEDAWMHEGAASFLANRIAEDRSGTKGSFRARQTQAGQSCMDALEEQGATIAGGGRTYRIAYDCGAVVAELTELLVPMSLEAFWTMAGEGFGGGPFSTEDFFAALDAAGAPPAEAALLEALIVEPQPDPQAAIAELYRVLERSG